MNRAMNSGACSLLVGFPPTRGGRARCLLRVVLHFLAFASLYGLLPAQHVLFEFNGDAAHDRLGGALACAGDVNQDGVADLIIGSPLASPGGSQTSGHVRVHSGADGSLIWEVHGDAPGYKLGYPVAPAGDVNADGVPDVLAGSLGPATVRVFSGVDGAVLAEWVGATPSFGYSCACAGDVDADGHDDIIIGECDDNHAGVAAGAARVYSGRTSALLLEFFGDAAQDSLGRSVDGAGDLDGDGHADLVVGARRSDLIAHDSGLVRVFAGSDGSVLLSLFGEGPNDLFGHQVRGVGDMNGDGVGDLFIAARQISGVSQGYVRLHSGADGSLLWRAEPQEAGGMFGWAVGSTPDMNGDGIPELLVGAHTAGEAGMPAGAARVLSGLDGSTLQFILGQAAFDQFGRGIASAGDIDGDGRGDFMVAAPYRDSVGVDSGSVLVFSGLGCDEPVTYCLSSPNSVGAGARISWEGTVSITYNDLALTATSCPVNQFGIFYYGPGALQIPFGDGWRCVGGGTVIRFPPQSSSADGEVLQAIDYPNPPQAAGRIQSGSNWNFQYWGRDPASGGSGFNLSDALSVVFCP